MFSPVPFPTGNYPCLLYRIVPTDRHGIFHFLWLPHRGPMHCRLTRNTCQENCSGSYTAQGQSYPDKMISIILFKRVDLFAESFILCHYCTWKANTYGKGNEGFQVPVILVLRQCQLLSFQTQYMTIPWGFPRFFLPVLQGVYGKMVRTIRPASRHLYRGCCTMPQALLRS